MAEGLLVDFFLSNAALLSIVVHLKPTCGAFIEQEEGTCLKTIAPISVQTSLYLTTPCYFSSNDVCFVFSQNPIYGVEYGCGKANGTMLPRQCGRMGAGSGRCWRRAYALNRVGWLCCCNWPRCNTRNNFIQTIEGRDLFNFDANAETTPQTLINPARRIERENEIAALRREIAKATRARWWHAPIALFVAFTIVTVILLIAAVFYILGKINRLAQEQNDFDEEMRRKFEYRESLQDELIRGIINRAAHAAVNEYERQRKIGSKTTTASRSVSYSTSAIKNIASVKEERSLKRSPDKTPSYFDCVTDNTQSSWTTPHLERSFSPLSNVSPIEDTQL